MSRSRRKTPIRGITTADSEKKDKRIANRRLRAATSQAIVQEREVMPEPRDVSDVYDMDKDGKKKFDVDRFPELMRK